MTTRGIDPERPRCEGCHERQVPAGSLVCPSCWGRVPRTIKTAVRAAHAHWVGDPTDQNWSVYMRARRDALETLT